MLWFSKATFLFYILSFIDTNMREREGERSRLTLKSIACGLGNYMKVEFSIIIDISVLIGHCKVDPI